MIVLDEKTSDQAYNFLLHYRREVNNNEEKRSHDVPAESITNGLLKSDIKQIFDKNSENFWNDVKMKFVSKDKQDGLKMLEDVYSK